MRKHLLAAGVAAVVLIPSLAMAQQSCEAQRQNRVAGTVVGAGFGALVGSALAGRHDRTEGAVVGGVGGAVIGNQLSKPNADCAHAYGFYDRNGAWHATAVERSAAVGYYDRNGVWVDGAPNGYYDSRSHWVSANNSSVRGDYDSQGRWVPATAPGYYDPQGRWYDAATTADRYRADTAYETRGRQRVDVRTREAWMDQRIRANMDDGSMSRRDGRAALKTLNGIRIRERGMSHVNGQLSQRDDDRIQARLDTLRDSLRLTR